MAVGAVVGSAVVGLGSAAMSSKSQKDAASKAGDAAGDAADAQTKAILEMFYTSREDYAPYSEAGKMALEKLTGYKQVETTAPGKWKDGGRSVTYKGNVDQRKQDRTYRPGYSKLPATTTRYVDGPPTWVPGETTTSYEATGEGALDPGGDSQKYMDALEALTFELDPTDDIYKWRQEEGEKAINSALVARGLHDSSYAVNRIGEFNRALTADETDRQYNQNYLREYGQKMDLFNMSNKLGAQTYNKYLDLVKIGAGAAGASGASAQNTGQQLSSVYGQLGTNQSGSYLGQGAAEGAFWSGVGGLPQNALSQYSSGKQLGLWGNAGPAQPTNYLNTNSNFDWNTMQSYG